MKIIAREKIENCFEGDYVAKYIFDCQWTKENIHALRELGHFRYYGSFPKPMFQIICFDGSIIKGVQGTCECRVIHARAGPDEADRRPEDRFEDIIKSF